LLSHPRHAGPSLPALQSLAGEEASATATLVAEALVLLGDRKTANGIYSRILTDASYGMMDRNFALNSIDAIDFRSPEVEAAVQASYEANIETMSGFGRFSQYDASMAMYLLKRWGLLE
jgi:hypothetical protein